MNITHHNHPRQQHHLPMEDSSTLRSIACISTEGSKSDSSTACRVRHRADRLEIGLKVSNRNWADMHDNWSTASPHPHHSQWEQDRVKLQMRRVQLEERRALIMKKWYEEKEKQREEQHTGQRKATRQKRLRGSLVNFVRRRHNNLRRRNKKSIVPASA